MMEFKLPEIGEGVREGEVTKWLVKAGDEVAGDQPLVEILTDKATVELPSPVKGIIGTLLVKEGETVAVGQSLVIINETTEKPAKPTAEPAPEPAGSHPNGAKEAIGKPDEPSLEEPLPFSILATPATRQLARELGVNLRSVSGTGIKGRITKEDVKRAHENVSLTAVPLTGGIVKKVSGPTQPDSSHEVQQRVPLRGIRKKTAQAMTLSKHKAAHFTYMEEADMTDVVRLRKDALGEAQRRGLKLTFLPFVIKALIPALKEFPYLNASLDDEHEEIVLKKSYNIGIATDTSSGLLVPVVKNADSKNVWELAEELEGLIERARLGKNSPEELTGGTFTVTNAGSIGGVFFTPIINYPQVAILGMGAIRRRPVVVGEQIVARDLVYLSLSVDHRVVDGADAGRFMNRLVFFLSDPARLVVA